jgi:hypothetical protein
VTTRTPPSYCGGELWLELIEQMRRPAIEFAKEEGCHQAEPRARIAD